MRTLHEALNNEKGVNGEVVKTEDSRLILIFPKGVDGETIYYYTAALFDALISIDEDKYDADTVFNLTELLKHLLPNDYETMALREAPFTQKENKSTD